MQEIDAQIRLAILRGETPPSIEDAEPPEAEVQPARGALQSSSRRKRKRPDEDDTDFELRMARERNDMTVARIEPDRKVTSSAPIVDHAGHIDLFGDEKARAHAEKNEDAEKEAKKKKQSYEDQYMMRFSNAAGREGLTRPWYSQSDAPAPDRSAKDVWGNEDSRRKERDTRRVVSNDPLAMMKQGASKVRELKQERKRFQQERAEELKQLRRDERYEEKRRRRHDRKDRETGGRRDGSREESRSRDSHRGDSIRQRSQRERADEGREPNDRRIHDRLREESPRRERTRHRDKESRQRDKRESGNRADTSRQRRNSQSPGRDKREDKYRHHS